MPPGRRSEPSDAPPGPPVAAPPLPAGTFQIDRDGAWRHEGQEVTHPGVLANLWANFRVEGDAHYLQVGPARIPVEVADAPFVVTRIEAVGTANGMLQDLWGQLSDGAREALEPRSIWLDSRNTPYCRVKAGRFRARLSVAAWLQLAPWLQPGDGPDEIALLHAPRPVILTRHSAP